MYKTFLFATLVSVLGCGKEKTTIDEVRVAQTEDSIAPETNALNKYFLVFCADSGVPGHAFVSFGYEDDEHGMSVTDGSFGFYPKDGKGIVGPVPGKIADDFLRNISNRYIKEVPKSEYDKALGIKKAWLEKDYELKASDCVSYVMDVAAQVSGLKIPDRSGLENFPNRYIKKLIEQNR